MSDRIDTHSQDLNPQHDPALCPSWCNRSHLTTAPETQDASFHHDSDGIRIQPTASQDEDGPEALSVTCSQLIPAEGPGYEPRVEIQNDSRTIADLLPADARELAAALLVNARLAGRRGETRRLALMEAEVERQVGDLTPEDAGVVRAVLLAHVHKLWQPDELDRLSETETCHALATEAERRLQQAGVGTCQSGLSWCSRCSADDADGTRYHRTTLTASDLLDVEVCQVTYSSSDEPSLVEPEFEIRVHDEPPLTAQQALQVSGQIVAAVEHVRG
jgi:hypothetical protein